MGTAASSCPLQDRLCVITGDLSRYSRAEAYAIIRKLGGSTSDNPVSSMSYLVLGRAVWSELNHGLAPRKVQKALDLQKSGKDIRIISEDDFYSIVDEYLPQVSSDIVAEKNQLEAVTKEIMALKIPGVGEQTAQDLATAFGTVQNLRDASVEQIVKVHGVDYGRAELFFDFLHEKIEEAKNGPLAGLLFVLTGVYTQTTRAEMAEYIQANGGLISGAVSSKTDYIIAGENPGPEKIKKAKGVSIQILTEAQFSQAMKNPQTLFKTYL